MNLKNAINAANELLPGDPSDDRRWQAIIAVGDYIASDPEQIWEFAARWGCHADEDLRDAIATLIVEHLLEHHFELIFQRVEDKVKRDAFFADMFCRCWKFGQSEEAQNSSRFDALQQWCKLHYSSRTPQ